MQCSYRFYCINSLVNISSVKIRSVKKYGLFKFVEFGKRINGNYRLFQMILLSCRAFLKEWQRHFNKK